MNNDSHEPQVIRLGRKFQWDHDVILFGIAVLIIGGTLVAALGCEKPSPPPPLPFVEGVIKNVQSRCEETRIYRPVVVEFEDGRVVIGLDLNKVTTFKKDVNNRIYYDNGTVTSVYFDKEVPDK